jgi:hypothetical protein
MLPVLYREDGVALATGLAWVGGRSFFGESVVLHTICFGVSRANFLGARREADEANGS